MAGRFSRVERRVWRDSKVRSLSRSTPNAREFWLYLLTCDSQDAFPGLYVLRPAVAAEDLGWERADVLAMMAEIESVGLVKFDHETCVVWLPNAPKKRVEEIRGNARNAKGWRNAWNEVPECEYTARAFAAALEAITEAADGNANAATVREFSAKPPHWLSDPRIHSPKAPVTGPKQQDGSQGVSQDRSQDVSNRQVSERARATGSIQDADAEEDTDAERTPDARACVRARGPGGFESEVDAIEQAIAPADDVCSRSGGARALAKLLNLSIPARRPGTDYPAIARAACLQLQGEIANGRHRDNRGLANLVRTTFGRLLANPDQLAVAMGASKFARESSDPDEPKSVLDAMVQELEREKARRAPRGGEPSSISMATLGLPATGTGGSR